MKMRRSALLIILTCTCYRPQARSLCAVDAVVFADAVDLYYKCCVASILHRLLQFYDGDLSVISAEAIRLCHYLRSAKHFWYRCCPLSEEMASEVCVVGLVYLVLICVLGVCALRTEALCGRPYVEHVCRLRTEALCGRPYVEYAWPQQWDSSYSLWNRGHNLRVRVAEDRRVQPIARWGGSKNCSTSSGCWWIGCTTWLSQWGDGHATSTKLSKQMLQPYVGFPWVFLGGMLFTLSLYVVWTLYQTYVGPGVVRIQVWMLRCEANTGQRVLNPPPDAQQLTVYVSSDAAKTLNTKCHVSPKCGSLLNPYGLTIHPVLRNTISWCGTCGTEAKRNDAYGHVSSADIDTPPLPDTPPMSVEDSGTEPQSDFSFENLRSENKLCRRGDMRRRAAAQTLVEARVFAANAPEAKSTSVVVDTVVGASTARSTEPSDFQLAAYGNLPKAKAEIVATEMPTGKRTSAVRPSDKAIIDRGATAEQTGDNNFFMPTIISQAPKSPPPLPSQPPNRPDHSLRTEQELTSLPTKNPPPKKMKAPPMVPASGNLEDAIHSAIYFYVQNQVERDTVKTNEWVRYLVQTRREIVWCHNDRGTENSIEANRLGWRSPEPYQYACGSLSGWVLFYTHGRQNVESFRFALGANWYDTHENNKCFDNSTIITAPWVHGLRSTPTDRKANYVDYWVQVCKETLKEMPDFSQPKRRAFYVGESATIHLDIGLAGPEGVSVLGIFGRCTSMLARDAPQIDDWDLQEPPVHGLHSGDGDLNTMHAVGMMIPPWQALLFGCVLDPVDFPVGAREDPDNVYPPRHPLAAYNALSEEWGSTVSTVVWSESCEPDGCLGESGIGTRRGSPHVASRQ